jgi:RHS repeat-associated protein
VFFDGERVARRDGPVGAAGVFYYFSDHLKTASVITDSAGVIKAELDYYPWGGELQFVNNDSNDYKFTGKKRDIETGLDYFGARYYSNGLGRWVSADWSAKNYVPGALMSAALVHIPGGGSLSVELRAAKVAKNLEIVGKYSDSALVRSAAKAEKSIVKHADLLSKSSPEAQNSITNDIRKAAERLKAIQEEQARRAVVK